MNVFLIIGVAISMINIVWVICIGRFIWGSAFGAFSVICAKFNNEICPIELKGPFGAIQQLVLCFGLCLPSTMALTIPSPATDPNDFWIKSWWRVIWTVPAFVAMLHIILLRFCFNHETPVYYCDHDQENKLVEVLEKYYQKEEVPARVYALKASLKANEAGNNVTYYETFFDPKIRRAAWVGIGMASL